MQKSSLQNQNKREDIQYHNLTRNASHRKRPMHISVFNKKGISRLEIYIAMMQSLFIAVVKKQSRLKELEQIITPLSELVHYVRFN